MHILWRWYESLLYGDCLTLSGRSNAILYVRAIFVHVASFIQGSQCHCPLELFFHMFYHSVFLWSKSSANFSIIKTSWSVVSASLRYYSNWVLVCRHVASGYGKPTRSSLSTGCLQMQWRVSTLSLKLMCSARMLQMEHCNVSKMMDCQSMKSRSVPNSPLAQKTDFQPVFRLINMFLFFPRKVLMRLLLGPPGKILSAISSAHANLGIRDCKQESRTTYLLKSYKHLGNLAFRVVFLLFRCI